MAQTSTDDGSTSDGSTSGSGPIDGMIDFVTTPLGMAAVAAVLGAGVVLYMVY